MGLLLETPRAGCLAAWTLWASLHISLISLQPQKSHVSLTALGTSARGHPEGLQLEGILEELVRDRSLYRKQGTFSLRYVWPLPPGRFPGGVVPARVTGSPVWRLTREWGAPSCLEGPRQTPELRVEPPPGKPPRPSPAFTSVPRWHRKQSRHPRLKAALGDPFQFLEAQLVKKPVLCWGVNSTGLKSADPA